MTRALLAARVSEDADSQDLDSQLIALRRAADRHDWTVVDELTIETSAWTPKTAARVKEQMLNPFREGRADVLAVWKLDRVVRGGIIPTLRFLRELEDHLGGLFYSVQEPLFSTATASPEMRELFATLRGWQAEQESNDISQRVRAKVRSKRNRAGVLNTRAKWGDGRLATPLELEMVHHFDELGYTRREIAKKLDLSKSQVQRIIKNDVRAEDVLTDEQLLELDDELEEELDDLEQALADEIEQDLEEMRGAEA